MCNKVMIIIFKINVLKYLKNMLVDNLLWVRLLNIKNNNKYLSINQNLLYKQKIFGFKF